MKNEIVNSNITKAILNGDYYEIYYKGNHVYSVKGKDVCSVSQNQCISVASFILISQLVEYCVHQFETKEFEDSLKEK